MYHEKIYFAPEVRVTTLYAERGFAGTSNLQDPIEKDPIEW